MYQKKVSLEIKFENPEVISAFADDIVPNETESNSFLIVPKGGAGLNLDTDAYSILVTFLENNGIEDFVLFFVSKIINYFNRDKIKFIKIRSGDESFVEITSNMKEDSIKEIVKKTLGLLDNKKE
ncbi:MAG: hypothetical protein OEZ36_00010 [Spirochaetota bacterium]|nr:hypothetical protein [Spirochaetota bacterium]